MAVFKAYDIRGKYPSEINEDFAYKLGRAFVVFTKSKEVFIGRDVRPSSYKIFEALAKGVTDQGADVIDLGLSSTPQLYFACAYHKKDGIMITASHLSKDYSGFKLASHEGQLYYYAAGGQEVERIMQDNKFKVANKKGEIKKQDILSEYKKYYLKKFWNRPKSDLKVVIDTGNMMGKFDGEILQEICDVIPLYFNLDGTMPNREPNPMLEKNTIKIRETIKEKKNDAGFILDGDGDRILAYDENAQLIPGDILIGLMAEYVIKPGDSVAYEVRTSWAVEEAIKHQGGIPLLAKAGNPFVKQVMKDHDSIFGGEKTGHYFFRDSFYAECSLGVALTILRILETVKKPLSELVKPLLKYFNSGEINFEVKDQDVTLKQVEELFKNQAEKILHIDGVSVYCNDFWFNLRKSNTEPLVRLNVEAKSKNKLEEMRKRLSKAINP